MTTGALAYVITGAQLLLGRKTAGNVSNRWNGIGGLVQFGDTGAGVIRHTLELLGAKPEIPEPAGEVLYHHPVHGAWKVVAYRVEQYVGQAASTSDMEIQWFSIDAIPFEQMWPGDELWVPLVIQGQKFQVEIWFDFSDHVQKKDIQLLK